MRARRSGRDEGGSAGTACIKKNTSQADQPRNSFRLIRRSREGQVSPCAHMRATGRMHGACANDVVCHVLARCQPFDRDNFLAKPWCPHVVKTVSPRKG